ncbi:MAG: 50S ribosomal protein L13 [Actinomycetota bacterium]
MRTYVPKGSEIERSWHVIDAEGLVLGRLATEVATLLRGKHKPTYTPNVDTGDHVIIVNAAKVVMTSGKAERTLIHLHSGYPGGLKSTTFAEALDRNPEDTLRGSITGMLPKGRLGRQMARKLKVYAGPAHPHAAQQPEPYEIPHARHVAR